MRAMTQRYFQFFGLSVLFVMLTLSGCQTAPQKA